MLAQADQDNIVYIFFLWKDACKVWANISQIISSMLSQTRLDNIG